VTFGCRSRSTHPDAWPRRLAILGALVAPAAFAESSPAEADAAVVDEIIVTARKIEENVQDIPMSIQVLSGEFLDDIDLSRMYDLQFNVPGLVVTNVGLFGAIFSMRGVTASVATHLNGIYLADQNLAIARMFDLERIEVLKGPQGTLYGRDSTGGSINYVTRVPEDSFSAGIEAGYGSFATTRVNGYLNLPFGQAAVRLAVVASEGDGYIRNSVDDRRFAEEDYWGVRASLQASPGESMRLTLMAQRIRDDGASGELWTPRPDQLVDPRDIRLTTVTLEDPYLVTTNDLISLNLEYDFGIATLRSISGYARSHIRNLDDCAGIPFLQGCVRGSRPLRRSQWSQEFQLAWHGTGPVDGLVGAYVLDANRSDDFHTTLPQVSPDPVNDYRATLDESVVALFGQATLRLSEAWSMTGGLRLSRDTTRMTSIGTGLRDSPTLVVGKHDSNDASWRFDLKYAASEAMLVYAGVATGYKSGGFTTSLVNGEPDSFDPENLIAYEAGVKSQWLDRRLTFNAAAFYYDYDDLQVNTVTFRNDAAVAEVDNAAKAELYGLDANGDFRVSARWTVSAGLVWLPRREYVRFENVETGDTLSGNKLLRAPEWTSTASIGYERPLRGLGTLSGRVEYNYRSRYFYTRENEPLLSQDGFGLLNVYLKYEAASRKWYVFASGRNLTDEDYFHQVFLQSSPGYPATYEVGGGYHF
jgi:iron complex outermembrane recepter protein